MGIAIIVPDVSFEDANLGKALVNYVHFDPSTFVENRAINAETGEITITDGQNNRIVAVIPIPSDVSKVSIYYESESGSANSHVSFIDTASLPNSAKSCTHHQQINNGLNEINVQSGDAAFVIWQQINDILLGDYTQYKFI